MKQQIEISVIREGGKPLFIVSVYDLDEAVNFSSYNCLWTKSGSDINDLFESLKESEYCEVLNDLRQLL